MQQALFRHWPKHDGPGLEPADHVRLGDQLARVLKVLQSDGWLTLRMLSQLSDAPEASVSARIRDLRKPKFGGYDIEKKRRGNTYYYRLTREVSADTYSRG